MLKLDLKPEIEKNKGGIIDTDILILGAGPAGLTAAIYTARANLKALVLHSGVKSQLDMGHEINNYPGFESITGSELLEKIRNQARNIGVDFLEQEAVQLNLNADPKSVSLRDGIIITATAVILAIGRGKRKKGIPGEKELANNGISYCSMCDGPLYRGRQVIAIGNPNNKEDFDDIILLHEMGCKVTVLTEESITSQSEQLINQGIHVIEEVNVIEILGKDRVEAVAIEYPSGDKERIEAEAVFIFGNISPTALLSQAGIKESKPGCVSTGSSCITNIDGVYAAGDLTCSGFQAVIAAGQGARAGMQAIKYVRRKKREKKSGSSFLTLG
ncbi:MAG: NAD(P)/FAD-dependent oxidoreductase [Candidatus Hodarchaeales archaeon]